MASAITAAAKAFPAIITHRVNSVDRLEAAVAAASQGIEFDIQMTADGKLILYHDKFLHDEEGRLLDDHSVTELSLEEIQAIVPGITTFAELLSGLKEQKVQEDFEIHAELKSPCEGAGEGMAAMAFSMIKEAGFDKQTIIRSFMPEHVKKAHEADARTCQLFASTEVVQSECDYMIEEFIRTAAVPPKAEIEARLGFAPELISVHKSMASSDTVDRLHGEGFRVCAYTVNPEADDGFALPGGLIKLDCVVTDQPFVLQQVKCKHVAGAAKDASTEGA